MPLLKKQLFFAIFALPFLPCLAFAKQLPASQGKAIAGSCCRRHQNCFFCFASSKRQRVAVQLLPCQLRCNPCRAVAKQKLQPVQLRCNPLPKAGQGSCYAKGHQKLQRHQFRSKKNKRNGVFFYIRLTFQISLLLYLRSNCFLPCGAVAKQKRQVSKRQRSI